MTADYEAAMEVKVAINGVDETLEKLVVPVLERIAESLALLANIAVARDVDRRARIGLKAQPVGETLVLLSRELSVLQNFIRENKLWEKWTAQRQEGS